MNIQIAPEFGYVILVFIASVFVLQWLGINVGRARKKYGVKYPTMYSDKDNLFNCIQRAHQNTLESYPIFLCLLFLSGLIYPRVSAVSGAVYLASRVVYAKGYYTGEPEARNKGAFGYLGLITMLVATIILGLQMLQIV